jgi:hypothetical protein
MGQLPLVVCKAMQKKKFSPAMLAPLFSPLAR